MQIFVIRHTTLNIAKNICYGQTEVPLASTFLEEVAAIKEKLPAKFEAVYCSTLLRCKALATELKYTPIVFDERLMEYNFGNWENTKWNNINPIELDTWMEDFVNIAAPNGENVLNLYSRVESFLNELKGKPFENVLLITHSGVIRCIWVYLLQLPLANMFKIPIGFGEILVANLNIDKTLDSIVQKM